MAERRQKLRVLLLQVREDAPTRHEELNEFVLGAGLEPEQFDVLDVFATPEFPAERVEGYDALCIGGSSDASVTRPEEYPFIAPALALLRHCDRIGLPVFASCFGFQLAAVAFGGRVEVDLARAEFGTLPIQLTEAGRTDPLLGDLGEAFLAVVGHKERAVSIPEVAEHLACTEICPYQAFRLRGRPFWAFQFHPEVTRADLVCRLVRYWTRYFETEQACKLVTASLAETPEANALLGRFIDRVVLAP